MIIVSWDVGVIHLAYCVLEYVFDKSNTQPVVNILDWDNIDLLEDSRKTFECKGNTKGTKSKPSLPCGRNASFYLELLDGKTYGFCKTHLSQSNNYWTTDMTKKLFNKINNVRQCTFIKKNNDICGKNARILHKNSNIIHYYCTPHYKSVLTKLTKDLSPQPIKNMVVKKYPTHILQFNLVAKLDELSEHFAKLGIEEIVIENQPTFKNPKMKSIANTLFDYFLIRGYVDKLNGMDIKLVRFICPSNKLKVNNNNTIEVFKANKNSKIKYKLTKELSVQYTKQLLKDDPIQLEYLDMFKKKDDICDAYLQGMYYLKFIRNKQDLVEPKKSGSSKKSRDKNVITI